jgi:putative tryptophan/tyrosine transport system substrate-binding protein
VDILAIQGAVTAHAAKKVVKDVPMVFAVVLDPVKDNLVTNLERPGGNLTGVTTFDPQEPRKQFQLLQRVVPTLQRVAVLGDAGVSEAIMKGYEEQALALGLQTRSFRLKAPNPDLEGVFAAMGKERVDALLIQQVPVMGVYLKEITQLAARDRIPTMYSPVQPDAGELLAYGTSFKAACRRMAVYVDKILKGAKAGDLSVETLTGYELIVNLKIAVEIGITIPPDVLKQADRVIQ